MGRKNNFVFGFTLIELIVVIAVLASLLLITLLVFNPAKQFSKSRDSQRKSDLNNIYKALVMYKNDFGIFPADSSDQISGCSPLQTFTWGTGSFSCGNMVYMKLLPQDPKGNSTPYKYSQTGSGTGFCLWGTLESSDDPSIAKFQQSCSTACAGLYTVATDIVVCND